MPVSATNSKLIYDALKGCGIRLMSALPETWLVHLIRLADEDAGMILVRRRRCRHLGRRAFRRSEVRHADAEPRVPGGGEWHRVFRAAL